MTPSNAEPSSDTVSQDSASSIQGKTPDRDAKRSFRRTLTQLRGLVPRGRRRRWALLALLAAVSAVVEAIGGLLIFGVLDLVQGGESRVGNTLEQAIRNVAPALSDSRLMIVLLVLVASFFVARAFVLIALTYAQGRLSQSEGARISHRLESSYLSADYEYHLSVEPSVLIRNVTISVDDATNRYLVPITRVFSESLTVVALVSILFLSAPVVTLLAALGVGIGVWVVMRLVRPKFHAIGRQNQDLNGQLLANLTESLDGIRDAIVTGSRWHYLQDFWRIRLSLARARVMRFTYEALPRYAVETLLIVGVLLFLSFEMSRGATESSIALIGLFAYTSLRTLPAVNRVTTAVNSIRYSRAAVDDVLEDLQEAPAATISKPDDVEPLQLRNDVRAEGVSFRYAGSDRLILDRVDLAVAVGESVGIAGPTGSGKSTLVDILLGLLRPSGGVVSVDGEPLDHQVPQWHRAVGVVSQKVFLANATLARNIAMGGPVKASDRSRIEECIKIAQLQPLVDGLPDGLDTMIGGKGVRLSGGERQRLAIARALYRNPQVLFMDEATSAIDGSTEAALVEAVRADNPERTLVMIAHRVNTLRDCDRVFVLRDGRVDAVGTYHGLLDSNQLFAMMARHTASSPVKL